MKKSLGAKTVALSVPTWVVGTYDADGNPNAMVAAWAGICCSKPPSLCVSLRSATKSHGHIMERRAFTVNVPSAKFAREADYFGLVSGRDADKFEVTGLATEKSELVDAPCIVDFPIIVECKVTHINEIGMHTQFIGEILDVKVDEEILNENGDVDATRSQPLLFTAGTRSYHIPGTHIGDAFSIGKHYIK